MDLQGYSNRDKSIINANPNANPYELKELGLSEKGFNRLLEGEGGSDYDESKSHIEDDADLESPNEDLKVNETAEMPAQSENYESEKLPENVLKIEVKKINQAPSVSIKNASNGQIVTDLNVGACTVQNLKNGRTFRMSVSAAKTLNKKDFKIIEYVN